MRETFSFTILRHLLQTMAWQRLSFIWYIRNDLLTPEIENYYYCNYEFLERLSIGELLGLLVYSVVFVWPNTDTTTVNTVLSFMMQFSISNWRAGFRVEIELWFDIPIANGATFILFWLSCSPLGVVFMTSQYFNYSIESVLETIKSKFGDNMIYRTFYVEITISGPRSVNKQLVHEFFVFYNRTNCDD